VQRRTHARERALRAVRPFAQAAGHPDRHDVVGVVQRDAVCVDKAARVLELGAEAELRGVGCVPIDGLMEDAATAEISRAQVWQWQRWGVALDDGSLVTPDRVAALLADEVARLAPDGSETTHPILIHREGVERAARLFLKLCTGEKLADFLTVPAYTLLTKESP